MKRGFTLLELIVVIIIIGILASLGFTQYTKTIEKARTAEARIVLGQIRNAEEAYKLEHGSYTNNIDLLVIGVPQDAPDCSDTNFYFGYSITAAGVNTFTAQATRCTSGGKPPDLLVLIL